MPLYSGRSVKFAPGIYDTPQRKRYRRIKFLGQMAYTAGKAIQSDLSKFPVPNYGDAGAALVSGAIHKLSGSSSSNKMTKLGDAMDLEKTPQGTKRGSDKISDSSGAGNLRGSRTSSANMSSLTTRSCSRMQKAITNMAEIESHKRSTPANYRLHAAKYLKMDAMLKQLFFPLHRFRGFFGFTSTSGTGLETALPQNDGMVARLAPRGAFRGISFFKVRHTSCRKLPDYPDLTSAAGQSQVLNAERVSIGTTDLTGQAEQPIYTYFRKYNNTPSLQQSNPPNFETGAGAPPNTKPEVANNMTNIASNYRQLGMDFNAADIERISLAESNFVPMIAASTGSGGAGQAGSEPWAAVSANNSGYEAGVRVYGGTAVNQTLLPPLKDAVIRIADGKLSMDIANGSRVPTVVELVIHSMKKQSLANNTLTQGSNTVWNTKQIYSSLWKAANWQHGEKSSFGDGETNPTGGPNNAPQGGWNTFWDPKTPFLKVSGPGKQLVDHFATEVHRSVHYLAPGESKTINIALGSLYYKIGSRSSAYCAVQDATSEDGKMAVLQ